MASSKDLPYMETLIIDYSLLSSPSPAVASDELRKLHAVLTSWGCFQLVNHGMSKEFLEEVRNVGRQFFGLAEEEKEKYARTATSFEGYGNDSITSENVPIKWQSRLKLTTYPLEERKLDRWPQTPHSFREVLHEYSTNVKTLNDKLIQDMARCLNLKENSFEEEYGNTLTVIARYQIYYPCSYVEEIRASSEHGDASAMTYLLQDNQVEGLEIMKDGKWFRTPVLPHAIFVNVGDQIQIMSNGNFKSPIHRVVPHLEKERISLPLFFCPADHKEIGPLKALITEDQPALYKKFKNYTDIFFRLHPKGIKPITTVKIDA